MRGKATLVAIACLLLFSPAARAAADQDSPVFRAAMEVLEATNARANVVNMIDTMLPLIMNQIKQQHPNANQTVLVTFNSALRDEMVAGMDDYMVLCARLYAQYFTDQELQATVQFYRTPAGRKFIETTPQLMKDLAPVGVAWGQVASQRAIERALEQLKQKGLEL